MTLTTSSNLPGADMTLVELDLYHQIMAYRTDNGLDPLPLSYALTATAGFHTHDSLYNIWQAGMTLPEGANLHSWSDAHYYDDHREPCVMWNAPARYGLEYPSAGYEISAAGFATTQGALAGWQGSPGHNDVILNQEGWSNATFNAIGIGVAQDPSVSTYQGTIYHVWFGQTLDPAGPPQIRGTVEADAMVGTAFADNFAALAGNDRATLGHGDDTARGGDGQDTLTGNAGEDELRGEAGADVLNGGNDRDQLFGGTGNDTLNGQRHADLLEGGAGADTLRGGGGDDTLLGGEGNDYLHGGWRADHLDGGSGNDKLIGRDFDDTLLGGTGNDTLISGADNDHLDGGAGRDFLNAGGGDDRLIGGAGDDKMKGGAGADYFVFNANEDSGWDIIRDFDVTEDRLEFVGLSAQDITVSAPKDHARLQWDDGTIVLLNVDESDVNWELIDFL